MSVPPSAPTGEATRPPARPGSSAELFVAFARMAMQGFGGVLPVAQRELVERLGWLDRAQFLDTLALAQVLPGPNVVNLALMIGDRFFGWRGALASLAGMLLAPLALVLVLAALAVQTREIPWVAGALRGMAVVAAGLIAATAIRLMGALEDHDLGLPGAALVGGLGFVAVGLLRWPLVAVVLGLGSVAVLAAWRRLSRTAP